MDRIEFGKYLRSLRKEKGLTLVELANLTGVSNPYISQIENGKFLPSPDILEKLAKGLKVSSINLMLKAGHLGEDAAKEVQSKGLQVYFDELIGDLSKTYEDIDEDSSEYLKDKKKQIKPLLENLEKTKSDWITSREKMPKSQRVIQEKFLTGEIDEEERRKLYEDEFGVTESNLKIENLEAELENLEAKLENLKLIQETANNKMDIMRLINQEGVSFLGKEISRSDKLKITRTIVALLSDQTPGAFDLLVTDSHKENKLFFDIDSSFYFEE